MFLRGAVYWFHAAAKLDNANGQFQFGTALREGRGIEQDDEKATHWIRQAAEQGHIEAQYQLARAYRNAQGVPKNDRQAHFWLVLLAKTSEIRDDSEDLGNTVQNAARLRDKVTKALTSGEIAETERLVKAWIAAHPEYH